MPLMVYYFKGSYVKRFFKKLIDKNIENSGEYCSLIYNLMVKANLNVGYYELEHFIMNSSRFRRIYDLVKSF